MVERGTPSPIDTRMLMLFDVLYELRSVSRAAEALDWSQPTVSAWLSRLRQDLRDPLFVRTADGMQPTPRADMLIETCRSALASLRHLAAPVPAFDPSTTRRAFKICVTDASHVTLLPALYRHFEEVAPGAGLEALRIGHETAGLLFSGEADLAIGMLSDLDAGFYQQVLYSQDWICRAREGHPRIGPALTIDDYAREGHLSVTSGASQKMLDDFMTDLGVEREIRLVLPGFLGVPAILRQSDLVATVPRLIGARLKETGSLRAMDCPHPAPLFDIKQHWHERFHHDPGSQWLRGVCVKLFHGHDRRIKNRAAGIVNALHDTSHCDARAAQGLSRAQRQGRREADRRASSH